MKAVLVGSGNVATHMAFALKASGITIVQVWSKHFENAKILGDQINAEAITNLSEVNKEVDFCIVSVKDDSISEVVKQLTGFEGIVVHTSGSVDLNVFGKSSKQYGVLYPLQTFSIKKELNFKTIPLCIEANDAETLKSISQLAEKLSDKVEEVSSDKRKILHLAAVFACNFTNHLYALSADLLADHDLSFEIIKPLILETAAKVQHSSPRDVQTGPAVRSDEQTLRKHEELLLKQPQLLTIYKTLSESIKKTKK